MTSILTTRERVMGGSSRTALNALAQWKNGHLKRWTWRGACGHMGDPGAPDGSLPMLLLGIAGSLILLRPWI